MRNRLFPLLPVVLLALPSGCLTTSGHCRIIVSNRTDAALTNVVVSAGSAVLGRVAAVPPQSYAEAVLSSGKPARQCSIRWEGPHGTIVEQNPTADDLPADNFRGYLYFQILSPSEVTCRAIPDVDNRSVDMPWAGREKWEGYPNIPGMNRE